MADGGMGNGERRAESGSKFIVARAAGRSGWSVGGRSVVVPAYLMRACARAFWAGFVL